MYAIDMKHRWVLEGTEGGIKRYWCEDCNWEREQPKDEFWYRRDIGQLVKRHWLMQWWSGPTVIVQWSDTEPECAPEKRNPRPELRQAVAKEGLPASRSRGLA